VDSCFLRAALYASLGAVLFSELLEGCNDSLAYLLIPPPPCLSAVLSLWASSVLQVAFLLQTSYELSLPALVNSGFRVSQSFFRSSRRDDELLRSAARIALRGKPSPPRRFLPST